MTELKLELATRDLRANTRPSLTVGDRFVSVVEASPIALMLTGPSGQIEMVNKETERLFGYDRAELQGMPVEQLTPERFRSRHADLRMGFLGDMSSRVMGDVGDLFGLRKDGTEFSLEIGLNPIDLDGVPMVLAGVIDITARRETELRGERQRRDLEQSNADLEEFAHIASHDLKAPLRGIAHLVQWISDDIEPSANEATVENLKALRGRVTRLQMLLDGLLAYSRVGHGQTMIEAVDVADVVRDIVTLLSPPPGFLVECAGTMPIIRTYRTPLQVVLENLISNGLRHHDCAEGRIIVSGRLEAGVGEFRVADDGPGISPRYHDRIFLMFQTLTSRDEVESSGIGLAIVKKKIEGHGGRIWIESAPPARGSAFVFTWKEVAL